MALEGGVQAEEVDAVLGRLTVCEYFLHVDSLRVTTVSVPWIRGWTRTERHQTWHFSSGDSQSVKESQAGRPTRTTISKRQGARESPGWRGLVPLTS